MVDNRNRRESKNQSPGDEHNDNKATDQINVDQKGISARKSTISNGVQANEDHGDLELTELIDELQEEWRRMDYVLGEESAQPMSMLAIVEQQRAALRKKMWRDLAIFWVVALVILAGISALYVADVVTFVIVQLLSLTIGLFVVFRLPQEERVES